MVRQLRLVAGESTSLSISSGDSFERAIESLTVAQRHAGVRAGDELVYVLRAFDAQGNFDETSPRKLQLVRPDEAEKIKSLIRESGSYKVIDKVSSALDQPYQELLEKLPLQSRRR